MRGFRYLKQVATLAIDTEHCIGCGACAEVCPHGVFQLKDKCADIVDFDACMECGACARNCPIAVFSVESGVGCASSLLMEWWQGKFPGSQSGCC